MGWQGNCLRKGSPSASIVCIIDAHVTTTAINRTHYILPVSGIGPGIENGRPIVFAGDVVRIVSIVLT